MIRDVARLEQVGGRQTFRVKCQAKPGGAYPQPNASAAGHVLPVVYVADTWPFDEAPRASSRVDLMWSASWHSPGFVMEAVRIGERLYAIPKAELYDVRVYEADGTIRWSADYFGGRFSYVNSPPSTGVQVAAAGGKVFVVGPLVQAEDPSLDPWSMVIYDQETGDVIRRVALTDPPSISTGGATLGDALAVAVNGTPPLYSDATHVFVLMGFGTNGSGGNSGQLVQRLTLAGEYVDHHDISTAGTGLMTELDIRPDYVMAWGRTVAITGGGTGDAVYGGGTWPGDSDSLHAINFGRDGCLVGGFTPEGVNTERLHLINSDGTMRWIAYDGSIGNPRLTGTVNAGMGDGSDTFVAHTRLTRLMGNIDGTSGSSATGAVSRWNATGMIQWLIDLGSGITEAARTLVWNSDDVLMVGGSAGSLSQIFTDGSRGWLHDHFTTTDAQSLPDGAAVFVGSRIDVSADTSFVA